MKLLIKISCIIAAVAMLTFAGCSKILVEKPQSSLTPIFLTTNGGVIGGISGVYSDLRNLWGGEAFSALCCAGTDETLAGGSASSAYLYNYNGIDVNTVYWWANAYQDINVANALIENIPSVAWAPSDTITNSATVPSLRNQYMAQAKFLRAFFYYHLVITFGEVPLHIKYIAAATVADSRQPIADVYAQIIQDLNDAIPGLTTTASASASATAPFGGKAAFKATALYLLAKTYLARGWSSAAQTNDFQQAATIASNLITNKSTYGIDLWQDFNDANKFGNDYGKETLMVIDHNNDTRYGEYVSQAAGGKVNLAPWFMRPNYPSVNANYPASGGSNPLQRTVQYGRPFLRTRPNNNYIYNQAFADLTNDTRYYKTFQTVWIANNGSVVTPRGTLVPNVDTAMWMPPFEVSAARRAAFKGIILTPSGANGGNAYTGTFFPAMRKYDDTTRSNMNDPSTRPLILFRFAEVYLIAAEAYLQMGDNTSAANMINTIRARAAYSRYRNATDNAAAMTAMTITPAQVTLDFILDERTREFYGESLRWWDLVRTQSLVRRVQQWNTVATPYIKPEYALRPIPRAAQIDLVTSGPPFPQNPGY